VFVHLNIRKPSGVFAFAVPNGGARNAKTGARLKAEGVKPGVPDIALLINGAPHFLELKTERGYLTQAQKRVREEIEAAGGQWAVAKGLDDALATLEHWGAIKPDLSMKCQMISGKGVMGGIGSGRYGGYRAATCEDDYAIDLPWLWQEGVLRRLGRDKGKRETAEGRERIAEAQRTRWIRWRSKRLLKGLK
jgi:hypothetical protein